MHCRTPYALRIVAVLSLGLAACATPKSLVAKDELRQHELDLDKATQSEHEYKLREYCKTPLHYDPPGIFSLFFRPWPNLEVQAKACAELHGRYDRGLATASTEAKAAKGGACLARAERFFTLYNKAEEYRMTWETDDARRASLAPVIDPCLADVEALAAANDYPAVFVAFTGNEKVASATVLTEPQRTRVAALVKASAEKTVEQYEAAAKRAGASQPYAGALYLAGAALVADAAGDAPARDERLSRANALLASASGNNKLSVTLTGGELAETIKRGSPSSYRFVDNGELKLNVKLGPPKLDYGQREVTRSATRRIERGTKANPEFEKVKKECERYEKTVQDKASYCASHPKIVNCQWYRDDVTKCHKKLSGTPSTVKAFAEDEVKYPATEFYGTATGTLELTTAPKPPQAVQVATSLESLKHAAVPQVNLSAQSGARPSAAALTSAYEGKAAQQVFEVMRASLNQLAATLLQQATDAPSADESATLIVRHTLVAGEVPKAEKLGPLDARLKLPTAQALRILLVRR